MFCNGHRERDQPCIKIGGITDGVMKNLIRFAYTSHLEIDRNNAQSLLEAGSFLQVTRIFLNTNLSVSKSVKYCRL